MVAGGRSAPFQLLPWAKCSAWAPCASDGDWLCKARVRWLSFWCKRTADAALGLRCIAVWRNVRVFSSVLCSRAALDCDQLLDRTWLKVMIAAGLQTWHSTKAMAGAAAGATRLVWLHSQASCGVLATEFILVVRFCVQRSVGKRCKVSAARAEEAKLTMRQSSLSHQFCSQGTFKKRHLFSSGGTR